MRYGRKHQNLIFRYLSGTVENRPNFHGNVVIFPIRFSPKNFSPQVTHVDPQTQVIGYRIMVNNVSQYYIKRLLLSVPSPFSTSVDLDAFLLPDNIPKHHCSSHYYIRHKMFYKRNPITLSCLLYRIVPLRNLFSSSYYIAMLKYLK